MKEKNKEKTPKIFQAILKEARQGTTRKRIWRGDWGGDSYPRYYKQGNPR